MKNTRENVVNLLVAMRRNTLDVARNIENINLEFARELRKEASGYQDAIWLLTEPDYFNKLAEIHFSAETE